MMIGAGPAKLVKYTISDWRGSQTGISGQKRFDFSLLLLGQSLKLLILPQVAVYDIVTLLQLLIHLN